MALGLIANSLARRNLRDRAGSIIAVILARGKPLFAVLIVGLQTAAEHPTGIVDVLLSVVSNRLFPYRS
jgi:hypothetical protein